MTDGAYFYYCSDTSTAWRIKTANNGTRTVQGAGVAMVEDAWIHLRITVNAAGTQARYYINGLETADSPLTTNIPAAGNRICAPLFKIDKLDGTNSRAVYIDAVGWNQTFTTARW
jgi:hypothetical protein